MLRIGVLTLFPEMFACTRYGVLGRAIENQLIELTVWNLRNFGIGKHQKVDDKAYGGGPGMVIRYEPLSQALCQAKAEFPSSAPVVYLSPQGSVVTQRQFDKIASSSQPLILLAGRYEGIDERIIDQYVDEEWSVGDYVLSGGEIPALLCIDAIARLLPGCLGHASSAAQDSFMNGLLDYPQYTRPVCVDEKRVPQVLLTGHHGNIEQWRRKQSLGRTWLKKPELLKDIELNEMDEKLLEEFKREHGK